MILSRILALAALVIPCSAWASSAADVSRFVVDADGSYAGARTHEYAGNRQRTLQAGPNTLDVSGVAQSNLLLDDAPVYVYDRAADVGRTTSHECAVHTDSLFRVGLPSDFFVSADLRHVFIRHTSNDRQNGGAEYPDTGGVAFRGTFSHEQKGDTGALIVGGGIEF